MKKMVFSSIVLLAAIVFIAGCSKVNGPSTLPKVFAQNVIPLNYGVEVFGSGSPITTSTFISGGKCFVAYTAPGIRPDTGFYKNADSGNKTTTKLEVLHAESSYKGLGLGRYVPSVEILLTEETDTAYGQRRYLRYVSGYFLSGNFNVFQDTIILLAAMFGSNPYGQHGSSFGEFRSIILQEGSPNRTVINESMTFPKKITVVEEYAAGEFWNQGTGMKTDCPTECEHFFRITVGSLGESPTAWYKPRPFVTSVKDSIDLGLCSLLVCKASVAPIDSAYAELENDDISVYFYARVGSKNWESFLPSGLDLSLR